MTRSSFDYPPSIDFPPCLQAEGLCLQENGLTPVCVLQWIFKLLVSKPNISQVSKPNKSSFQIFISLVSKPNNSPVSKKNITSFYNLNVSPFSKRNIGPVSNPITSSFYKPNISPFSKPILSPL